MIPLNDGLEYLNDGMNFLYCRPVEYYYETKIQIDTLTIPLSSGEVDEDDLINLMDEAADLAGAFYHADQRGDKEPLMFDFNIIFPTSSTSANIQVVFYYMGGLMPETIDAYPYADSWIYGQYLSDVSEFCSEEEENFDAADLFRRDLRKELTYRSKFDYYYFIGPEYACYHPLACGSTEIPDEYNSFNFDLDFDATDLNNGDDITDADNFYDLLIFSNYSGWSNFHECLSIAEMNFYYEEMYDLAINFLPDPVDNKAITNIEVGYNIFLDEFESSIAQTMIAVKATKVTVLEEHKEPIALPDPE